MTESKNVIVNDLKGYLYEAFKTDIEQESAVIYKEITAIKKDIESDLIDKKRAEKRWRQTLNYYYLHPEKFRFGIKDL